MGKQCIDSSAQWTISNECHALKGTPKLLHLQVVLLKSLV